VIDPAKVFDALRRAGQDVIAYAQAIERYLLTLEAASDGQTGLD
jgi:hypothetical protein